MGNTARPLVLDPAPIRFLRTREAARYMAVAATTLIAWRKKRRGPVPIRLSANRVVYDRLELDGFMQKRATFERQPTAAAARAAGLAGAAKAKATKKAVVVVPGPEAEVARP